MAGVNQPMMIKSIKGITLIELMITVAIIGILASIAYPSYRDYVLRSNRSAATACIMEISHFMERSYSANFSYVGITLPNSQCITDLSQRYTFRLDTLAARTYRITATPSAIQAVDGCGLLTYNQAGRKGAGANGAGDAATVQRCW